jgi:SPP1 gp7 family putative phage head morphogenesis protein
VDTNELRKFAQSFWVHSCVKTLINEITTLEWDIVPRDEMEYQAVQQEILQAKRFFEHPNKNGESFEDIMKAYLKDILELDAGVIVKVFTRDSFDYEHIEPKSGAPILKPWGSRKLEEIYARDGASFLKETDKYGYCLGYWQYSYQIPAHPMWFNKEEIVYSMAHPRSMSVYGYAPVQSVLDQVKSLHWSTLYNKAFYEENAIPDGMITVKDTSDAEIQRLQEQWNRDLAGKPHKLVFGNKDMSFQPFLQSARELEFLETQKWYFKLVISAFDLTPSELGFTEDSNRATAGTQVEVMRRKGIRPLISILERDITSNILGELGLLNVKFKFVVSDLSEEAQRVDIDTKYLSAGLRTVNEIRIEQGLEPVAWGEAPPNLSPPTDMFGQPTGNNPQLEPTPSSDVEQGIGAEEQHQIATDDSTREDLRRVDSEEIRQQTLKPPQAAMVGARPQRTVTSKSEGRHDYEVKQTEAGWEVIDTTTGAVRAKFATEAEAKAKAKKMSDAEAFLSTECDCCKAYQNPLQQRPDRPMAQSTNLPLQTSHPSNRPLAVTQTHKPALTVYPNTEGKNRCPKCGGVNISSITNYAGMPMGSQVRCLNCGNIFETGVDEQHPGFTPEDRESLQVTSQNQPPQTSQDANLEKPEWCPFCRNPYITSQGGGTWKCPSCNQTWTEGVNVYFDQAPPLTSPTAQPSKVGAHETGNQAYHIPDQLKMASIAPPMEDLYLTALRERYTKAFAQVTGIMEKRKVATDTLRKTAMNTFERSFENDDQKSIEEMYSKGAKAASEIVGVRFGLTDTDNEAIRILKDKNKLLIGGVSARIKAKIAKILRNGIFSGASIREIKNQLGEIPALEEHNLETIARTETAAIMSQAQLNTYEKAGLEKVEFLATGDSRKCEKCWKLNGKKFTLDKAKGLVPQHPNCRCDLAPYMEG